ncbi:MAG: methyltransferase domain-containing protein, partial [Symbiobacteriaceae bacterium]
MAPRSAPSRPGRSAFEDPILVERYDGWFDRYPAVVAAELEAIRQLLPPHGRRVEVGVGTGRFASALGIRHGVDPSAAMRRLALRRGVEAVDGVAERLPYGNASFDAVLMVTTDCFIDDLDAAFRETCRVLRPGGVAVVALIDRDSPLGRLYQQQRESDPFLREARFRSVGEITAAMERAGLVDFAFRQTLFRFPDQVTDDEPVREGHGKGSFVVVRGRKPLASLPLPGPLAAVRLRRRLNRFAIEVETAGAGAPGDDRLVLHLPNSGRMEELLQPGAEGRARLLPVPGRRTAGDLLLVRYAGRWVSVDARMPNRLFAACLEAASLPPFAGYQRWQSEVRW